MIEFNIHLGYIEMCIFYFGHNIWMYLQQNKSILNVIITNHCKDKRLFSPNHVYHDK